MTSVWTEPALRNYLAYFGKTKKPRMGFVDGRPDELVRLASKIYSDDKQWFETDLQLVKLPSATPHPLDMAYVPSGVVETTKIPKKTKMIVTDSGANREYVFNLGYQNVFDESGYQVWVLRR